MLGKEIKKTLRQIRRWPTTIRHQLYQKFPDMLGHQVHGSPVQLYRHDQTFTTAVSFNHFIEFFSNLPRMNLSVIIEAFDKNGKSLGEKKLSLNQKGSFQFLLPELFPNLDSYGLFSVGMRVENKFIQELSYLGTLYPQYMTIFVPQDQVSAPQMIHSHKLRQGKVLVSRTLRRLSSDIETSQGILGIDLYFLNSSASRLKAQVDIFSGTDGKKLQSQPVNVPGYGIGHVHLNTLELNAPSFRFEYEFDRNVDHKKPILFRQFSDLSQSCNHT